MHNHKRAEHQGMFNCGHCGHTLNQANILFHCPTGEWIIVGADCIERFHMTALQYKSWRNREQLRAQRTALTEKLHKIDPRLVILADRPALMELHNRFLSNIADQAEKYDLSEKQVAAVLRTLDQIEDRQREKAERMATAQPAPSGKAQVVGRVLSIKDYENDYGVTWKMIVEDDRGFRVFVSVPRAIDDVERGDRVTFVATLTPADDDPTFAFGKRPTKAAMADEETALQPNLVTA